MINVLIESDRVELLAGAGPNACRFPAPGPSGSRSVAARNAIRQFGARTRRKSVLFVRAGTLDDPSAVEPDVHIYTRSKVPWLTLPETTPAFTTYYDTQKLWPAASLERIEALQSR